MPNVISPEFLFTDKNSRSIMDKIKVNLDNLCEKERNVNLRTIFYKSTLQFFAQKMITE